MIEPGIEKHEVRVSDTAEEWEVRCSSRRKSDRARHKMLSAWQTEARQQHDRQHQRVRRASETTQERYNSGLNRVRGHVKVLRLHKRERHDNSMSDRVRVNI